MERKVTCACTLYSENRARGDGDLGANAFVDRVNPD